MEGMAEVERQKQKGWSCSTQTKTIPKDAEKARFGVQEAVDRSNDDEQKKVALLRAIVEAQDPSSKEYDDFMIRRFLRARNLDIEKAAAMFLKFIKWRRTFVPNGSISVSEIPNEIAQNKMFMQGLDRLGRPIAILFAGRHYQNTKGGLNEFKRFVVFCLDKIWSRMPAGQEKFTAIGDLGGWGYSNSDIRGYLASLTILQEYHPERLGKVFLIHVPYIFMAIWKIIYPLIDDKTKEKFVFVEDKELKSTLLKDIDESQLPEIFGGKLKLVPIQDS